MEKHLICVSCPIGCYLTARMKDSAVHSISGNRCKRGMIYAESELTNPLRMVTTTLKVKHGTSSVVSVKTESSIPKEKMFEVLSALQAVELEAPIKIGDVVMANVANTAVDVVATKRIQRADL